jgi:hypothetical protein
MYRLGGGQGGSEGRECCRGAYSRFDGPSPPAVAERARTREAPPTLAAGRRGQRRPPPTPDSRDTSIGQPAAARSGRRSRGCRPCLCPRGCAGCTGRTPSAATSCSRRTAPSSAAQSPQAPRQTADAGAESGPARHGEERAGLGGGGARACYACKARAPAAAHLHEACQWHLPHAESHHGRGQRGRGRRVAGGRGSCGATLRRSPLLLVARGAQLRRRDAELDRLGHVGLRGGGVGVAVEHGGVRRESRQQRAEWPLTLTRSVWGGLE